MTQPTLRQLYADLQAERERNWAPQQLEGNAAQRRALVARHDPASYPQPGDTVAPFTLIDADGKALTRDDLLANGPAVLVFFRFAGCPACNLALPYYNRELLPALKAAGIPLIAVSAQNPVDLGIIDRHGLEFPVTGDPDYALGRKLSITFLPEAQPPVAPGQPWIGATLGTDSYEIDQPAVVILNADATLRHLIVSPDWLDRPEAADILVHLPETAQAAAA
jgi:peroxiredoxin